MMTLLPNILIATIAVLGILIFQRLLLSIIVSSLNNRSDQEKRAAAGDSNNIWRTKNKVRSGSFMRNALYHHIVIKARRTIHGMAGFICLCLTFTQTLWMLASGGRCRGLATFDKVVALAIVGLHMGFFTPWFKKRKMERLGKYTYMQHSMASIAVAFVMTANSKYAHDNFPTGEVNLFTWACNVIGHLYTFLAISAFGMSMVVQGQFNSPVPGIAITSSIPFVAACPVYEVLFGKEALASLYNTHRIGDLVYFLNMSGALVQLSANTMTVMALMKTFTIEQSLRINNKIFLSYGLVSMAMITATLGSSTCLVYVLLCGLAIPFHKVFPVRNLSKNRK